MQDTEQYNNLINKSMSVTKPSLQYAGSVPIQLYQLTHNIIHDTYQVSYFYENWSQERVGGKEKERPFACYFITPCGYTEAGSWVAAQGVRLHGRI